SRERFVDRRVILYPRIATRDCLGEMSQPGSELVAQQVCVLGPAAVMNQADDGVETKLTQSTQAYVRPREVVLRAATPMLLPQDWKTHAAQTQRREVLEVFQTRAVTRAKQLLVINIPHAIDGA